MKFKHFMVKDRQLKNGIFNWLLLLSGRVWRKSFFHIKFALPYKTGLPVQPAAHIWFQTKHAELKWEHPQKAAIASNADIPAKCQPIHGAFRAIGN